MKTSEKLDKWITELEGMLYELKKLLKELEKGE